MRVTTQMLNETQLKAGLSTNQPTLLDYINDSSSTSSLYDVLTNSSNVSSTQKLTYEQLEKSADALTTTASNLSSDDEDNIFEKARESGDTKTIKSEVEALISDYNDVLKKLTTTSSTMNTFYKQMLTEAYDDSEESLSSIGIIADKNGYISLDASKFNAADIDTLEKALGKDSEFTAKAAYIAERVSNNAETNIESLSNSYNSTGTTYSSYLTSKYDLWG